MLTAERLAKVMAIAAGKNPSDKHNGYDYVWQLYIGEAFRISELYNTLYPENDDASHD